MAAEPFGDWILVVPVKGSTGAKSRFGPGDNSELALAMALDTVEVASTAGRVIVVTKHATAFAALGVDVIPDPGRGLNAAISRGVDHAGLGTPRAVLLGDHPALTPDELAEVLAAAAGHPKCFVADAEGEGTALTAAAPGVPHAPHFGLGSAAAHRSAGYVELGADAGTGGGEWPGLRRDVDTAEQLAGLTSLGPRTRALLGARHH